MLRTCLPILAFVVTLSPAFGQTAEQKKATIEYLRGLQTSGGGFTTARVDPATDPKSISSLRATSSALRALKYFGGDARDRDAAGRFVASCFDNASGGFADQPGGKPDVTTTAVGLMAIVELKLPSKDYEAAIKYLDANAKSFEDIRIAVAGLEAIGKPSSERKAWLKRIAEMRNDDGTYGQGKGIARTTGSAVVAVLRLESDVEQRANVLKVLRLGQRPDGGWGKEDAKESDLETSYRIMRAFVMLKEKPASTDDVRTFIGKCRNSDGGYGVMPGQPSSISATYFAAIILHWLDMK